VQVLITKMAARGLSGATNLVGWLGRAQLMPRIAPPSHVLDHLLIAPLSCHQEDDLQGIGPNFDAPIFNPEPPTYALR
jgi:hypothetical protein